MEEDDGPPDDYEYDYKGVPVASDAELAEDIERSSRMESYNRYIAIDHTYDNDWWGEYVGSERYYRDQDQAEEMDWIIRSEKYDLSDKDWELLREHVPDPGPQKRGGRWSDPRLIVEAILWREQERIKRHGDLVWEQTWVDSPSETQYQNPIDKMPEVPWRQLPKRYGPWQTVWARYSQWKKDGVVDTILYAYARLRRLHQANAEQNPWGRLPEVTKDDL